MTEPPETAGKPNTVDCLQYVRQWAIVHGYDENSLQTDSLDDLLLAIAAGIPE